jgi:hypothetical protein
MSNDQLLFKDLMDRCPAKIWQDFTFNVSGNGTSWKRIGEAFGYVKEKLDAFERQGSDPMGQYPAYFMFEELSIDKPLLKVSEVINVMIKVDNYTACKGLSDLTILKPVEPWKKEGKPLSEITAKCKASEWQKLCEIIKLYWVRMADQLGYTKKQVDAIARNAEAEKELAPKKFLDEFVKDGGTVEALMKALIAVDNYTAQLKLGEITTAVLKL